MDSLRHLASGCLMRGVAVGVFTSAMIACSGNPETDDAQGQVGGEGNAGSSSGTSAAAGRAATGGLGSNATTNSDGTVSSGGARPNGGATGAASTRAVGGESATGGTQAAGGAGASGGARTTGSAGASGGTRSASGGARTAGGTSASGGTQAAGGDSASGGLRATGGTRATVASGGTAAAGGVSSTGGTTAMAGASGQWPNIRVVGNHLCDRWGKPFALRSIESMFGNGTSNASAFVAGHKALGANALGPLPNSSVSSVSSIEALLAAAYAAGLVIGLNADHTNQGERFFQNAQLQAVINRYPNVFLQEAVELGSDMSASEWVRAAQDKVDAYVSLYPDKPLKIGSPFGGRSPRVALDHCEEIVEYYYSKGGRGGLIFTCQLYWKAANSSWSYQAENGFSDGLAGILEAIDTMASSPCLFVPGLDNEDDVGYTGWREVMDHVRASNSDPGLRLGYQWWVYYNSGDPYDNDLTTNPSDALSGITSTGRDVRAKLEADREYVELGPLNP